MDSAPMINRLYALGFHARGGTRYVFQRAVGGRRELRVVLLEDHGYSYYLFNIFSGARATLLFWDVEDMELAIIYQTLVGRRRAWPMDWLGDSDHA